MDQKTLEALKEVAQDLDQLLGALQAEAMLSVNYADLRLAKSLRNSLIN